MRRKKLMTRALSIALAAIMAAPTTAMAAAADLAPVPAAESVVENSDNVQTTENKDADDKDADNKDADNKDAENNDADNNDAETDEKVNKEEKEEEKETEKTETSTFAETLSAPKVKDVKKEGSIFSKYYRVYFEGDAAAYLKALDKEGTVSVNGENLKEVKQSFFNDTKSYKLSNDPSFGGDNIYIDMTEDCFESEASVEIKAAGYKALQFKFKDGEIQEEAALKTAPKAKELNHVKNFMDNYYRLSFEGSDVATFLKAMEKGEVLLNGKKLSKAASFWNTTESYKFSNDPSFGGDNIYVDFTADCFENKEVSVELKAEGYEVLTIHAKNGELAAEEEGKFVTAEKAVDLGWSKYLVVDLEDGFTLENVEFEVDGKTIQPTKVTDDGNIVKWEVSSLDHKELIVKQGTKKQSIDLKGKGDAEAVVAGKTAPDYFMANGPVYVWDYYLRNFDDEGNVRIAPAKTTFNLDDKAAAGPVKYYSPEAELIVDESAPYGVSGEVELMFNYANGTEAEKAFVDGINDVDLVAYNENKNTLNDNLEFTLDKAYAHNGKTVACVKVPLGQSNLYSNGRYYLRVKSNGKSNLFPIHVVNSVVPSMILKDEKVVAGQQDVHFTVKDLTYAITMPIYKVNITDPDGNTKELKKIDDWYLIGDLFVLYNNEENYLAKAGNYTLDVYADGFKPFSKTFAVSEGTKELKDGGIMVIDAISTASVGGSGGGSSDGGDMDTNVMNANLIFDADLLINAKLLVEMNMANSAATGISDRWDSMSKVSVYMKGAESVYDAAAYFDAVNAAKTENKYLSFKDYIAGGNAEATKNRPYSVKQVLEDNLLGDITNFNDSSANQAPDMILVETTETTATFRTEDTAYLAAIQSKGDLVLNGKAADYTVDTAAKTLVVRNTKVGENKLTLKVAGYKTFSLPFVCEKKLQDVSLKATGKYIGEKVSITCKAHEGTDCDYMKHIDTIVAVSPAGVERTVRPEGAESEGVGYTIDNNVLTIGGKIFTEKWAQDAEGNAVEGTYTFTITSEYYAEETVSVELQVKADASTEIAGPTVKEIVEDGNVIMGKYDRVVFNGTEEEIAKFVAAIENITVNDKKVDAVSGFFNTKNGYRTAADETFGGAEVFVEFTKDCLAGEAEVMIKAEGYKPVCFNVKDGKLAENVTPEPEKPAEKLAAPAVKDIVEEGSQILGTYYRVSFEGEESKVSPFIDAIEKITVNGTELEKAINFHNTEKAYKPATDPSFGGENIYVEFTKDCFEGKVEVVINAKGYEELRFNVTNGELGEGTPDPEKPENPDPEKPENPDPENPENPEVDKPGTPDNQEVTKPGTKPVAPGKKPVAPGKKPVAPGKKPSPKTADTANVFGLMATMMGAAGAVAVTSRRRKRD